jgi:hypothetical protein
MASWLLNSGKNPNPRRWNSEPFAYAHSGGFCSCGLSTPMLGRLR